MGKFAREIYPGQFEPSPCHKFIRCVEKQGKLLKNYTQNIDTLEQVVGINKVIQCHGSFATATCTVCKHKVQAEEIKQDIFDQKIPYCSKCNNPPDLAETNSSEGQSKPENGEAGPSTSPSECPTPTSSTSFAPTPPPRGIMKPDIVFFG